MSKATYEHCIHAYACAAQLARLRGKLADGETYSILHLVRDLGCGEDCDAYDDTDDLREYVDWLYEHGKMAGIDHGMLLYIADRIDSGYERGTDDRVEVVRCWDCVHSYFVGGDDNFCDAFGVKGIVADGFCSNGERREVVE